MDARYITKVKRRDRVARWLISLGGVSIIGSMLVMIIFMVKVTMPLFEDPSHELQSTFRLPIERGDLVLFEPGPYLENGLAITKDGSYHHFDLKKGEIKKTTALSSPSGASEPVILRAEKIGKVQVDLYWADGSVTREELKFLPRFNDEGVRRIELKHERIVSLAPITKGDGTEGADAETSAPDVNAPGFLRTRDEGEVVLLKLLADGKIFVHHKIETEDFMGDITSEVQSHTFDRELDGALSAIAFDNQGRLLYLGSDQGELLVWDLANPIQPVLVDKVGTGAPIASMRFFLGSISVAIANDRGELQAWTVIPGKKRTVQKIHDLPSDSAPILEMMPSNRDKTMACLDESGVISLYHLTAERRLLSLASEHGLTDFAYSERGNGILGLDRNDNFWLWNLKISHPEVNGATLWSKIWYEGYTEPGFTWQSSSASDDFEPKLSLVPLVFGSLKGTFYGMMLSFPLAFFAALYVSHLMNPNWRPYVKAVIEFMGAIPTVVVGFLAALWLAPRLENNLVALMTTLVTIPIIVTSFMVYLAKTKKPLTGREVVWATPAILVGIILAWFVGTAIQSTFFGGNLNLWLYSNMGISADQRNCVVIAFALSFAVIPIIFTISEDSLFNVPKNMSAAALALGSSRWQTLRHVVLPMASPGIFAATMIGFGRAVGETMIVLMATGNTPIMSPSILNGMRTLSANIAVEIPEAPVGGSLYRTLFLSAVLLFLLTSVVNTGAEMVRVRLRKKYQHV